jgi:hypothetical protein
MTKSMKSVDKVIKELEKRKTPIVRIDKSLDKYRNVVLFPDKLEKANEMLRTIGLPKQWIK